MCGGLEHVRWLLEVRRGQLAHPAARRRFSGSWRRIRGYSVVVMVVRRQPKFGHGLRSGVRDFPSPHSNNQPLPSQLRTTTSVRIGLYSIAQ